jgi:hypothetical protein
VCKLDGTLTDMDPWRQAVESRLGELRTDIRELRSEFRSETGAIKVDLTAVKVDLAAVKVRVEHLPTKSFIVTALLGSLAAFSAITVFAGQIRGLFGVH